MVVRVVADTRERFRDFGPYVASMADDGAVAFWAGEVSGDGVFVARDGIDRVDAGDRVVRVTSHPDLNRRGDVCFYAELIDGEHAVVRVRDGAATLVATGGIGPLGPTMNEAGVVAYRATDAAGTHRVLADADVLASSGPELASFDGLPVVNGCGAVVYRATRADGSHAICVCEQGRTDTIADTRGSRWRDLARFPIVDDRGRVAFCAIGRDGRHAALAWEAGETRVLVEGGDRFETMRGVLISGGGAGVFFATPAGGSMGIYSVADPSEDAIFAIGDALHGSTVAAFVLNPVSINAAGQLAIRAELADGTGCILRLDP